ncbi:MAG TPA: glycosyltransferase family 39 protein [Acidimicrobiales bacterium]
MTTAETAEVTAEADAPPVAAPEPPRRWSSRRLALAALALLSVQFAALSLHQAWNDALTVDEAPYMATGLAILNDGETRLNNEAPFFPKAVNALPMRIAGVHIPLEGAWAQADTISGDNLYDFGPLAAEFIDHHTEYGNLQQVVFVGRLMPVLEGLALVWVLYALGATLFSRGAGLLAAAAWSTTPLAIGFGHVNGLDLAFALAVAAAALALARHLRAPSWRTLAVLALAAGALQLVRHTGVLYVAVICVALVVARWRDRAAAARDVAIVLVATWALVWVAILVVAPTRTPVDHAAVERYLDPIRATEQGAVAGMMSDALGLVPWPAEYEVGFQVQLAISDGSSPGFLLGDAWQGARPAFWPLAMVVKLPVTVVALVLLAPLGWRTVGRERRRTAVLVAVLPTLAAFAFVLPYGRPIGLRYALPGIVMLVVVASPLALALVRRRAGQVALGIGAVAQLAFLWSSVPHSLAWTAPPFRPAHRVVSESNLDWGQDGYRLAAWLEGRTAHVAYLGGADPVSDLPGHIPLLGTPPEEVTGWVAVSATLLTTYARDELAWLRAHCHVGTIGGSIVLFRFDVPPTAEPGPAAPAGRCRGPVSYRV